jgi:hypothetical protein
VASSAAPPPTAIRTAVTAMATRAARWIIR